MGKKDIYILGSEGEDEEGARMKKKKKFIWQTLLNTYFSARHHEGTKM